MTDWYDRKHEMLNRLKRAEGQLRGVQRLVDEEDDCEKVVQQLAAARKALDKVFYKAVTCALERELEGQSVDIARIEKYTQLFAKYG